MGIKNLNKLILKYAAGAIQKTKISDYRDKTIAIDISIIIYQLILGIRSTGSDLKTKDGRITSHIYGIINKTLWLLENHINPIFIFDGAAPTIKGKTLLHRKNIRKEAAKMMHFATDKATHTKLFKRSLTVKQEQLDDCKEILQLLNLHVITAPEEADSQCASLVRSGVAYATSSEDMDILTFGSERLIKGLSVVTKKKLGPSEVVLSKLLELLEITYDQFIDLCILLGCDYTDNIKHLGAKKSLDVIKKYITIEAFIESGLKFGNTTYVLPADFDYKKARASFKSCPAHQVIIKNDITIQTQINNTIYLPAKSRAPDCDKLENILMTKYEFNKKSVTKITARIKKLFKI
ncbi:MAG: Flap endonuclease 1 [Faunusvirus sp.]|jgi:flap endonuclease-1|uniref:Flap endonuclease 1 n=1 Tax=Faunusvirus sp. TaxID=2487766 RepID=A0A3G4ZWF1_9VIRU|nr:MAG: Flap endonuclease 1 [Faunusvirus sp.]